MRRPSGSSWLRSKIFEASHVIYLGLDRGTRELRQLYGALNCGCLKYTEPFPYHPHTTIAQNIRPGGRGGDGVDRQTKVGLNTKARVVLRFPCCLSYNTLHCPSGRMWQICPSALKFRSASRFASMKSLSAAVLVGLAVVVGSSILPVRLQAQQYVISTFAGGGFAPTPATGTNFKIGNPADLATDAAGNIYFVSLNSAFKLDSQDILTRLAGTGAGGYSADGGVAVNARLFSPGGVAADGSGNLYIADTSNARIRRVTPGGIIATVAGNGTAGYSGDGGTAVDAQLNNPGGIVLDVNGNLYIFDSSNLRIRKVSTSGIITTVAGNGTAGYSGDGGAATDAEISAAHGIAVDGSGNLYIADTRNQRIRRISTGGTITTVAGNTTLTPGEIPASTGNGGPAIQAQLNLPSDVAVDGAGNIYIAEADRHPSGGLGGRNHHSGSRLYGSGQRPIP